MKEDKLKEMKKEYNNIKIPETLKGRLEETIRQAKEENKKSGNRRRAVLFAKYCGATAAAAVLGFVILVNASPVAAETLSDIPFIGAITKVVTFRNFQDKKDGYSADIKIPQIGKSSTKPSKGLTDAEKQVNHSVEKDMKRLIEKYKEDYQQSEGKGHESVDTEYHVVTDNKDLFTLRVDILEIMASSDTRSMFYHIDRRTNRIIELKDLFMENADYISVLSKEVIRQMREKMKNEEGADFFIDSEDMPEEDFKQIKKNQNFYLNKDGKLVLVFDKYEVAPGYVGQVEFVIPYKVIESILVEDSFVGN